MGLEELLTGIDKKIWQKCEKITQLASKELGWNKYDLKRITDLASSIFLTGAGAYSFIQGAYQLNADCINFGSCLLTGIGAALIPGGFLFYARDKKENQRCEELERKLLEDKAVMYAPEFGPYRPVSLGCGITFLPLTVVYKCTHENNVYYAAVALFFSTIGTSLATKIASTYFQDQHMMPPAKKKSLWENIYKFVLQPFQKVKEAKQESMCTDAY